MTQPITFLSANYLCYVEEPVDGKRFFTTLDGVTQDWITDAQAEEWMRKVADAHAHLNPVRTIADFFAQPSIRDKQYRAPRTPGLRVQEYAAFRDSERHSYNRWPR